MKVPTKTRQRWWLACAVSLATLVPTLACAGSVVVEIGPDGTLSVVAEEVSLDEVIAKVRELKPFPFEQLGPGFASAPINRRLSGPTRFVVEQLMQDENHLIYVNVRTREVERLVVLGPRRASEPQMAANARPSALVPAPEQKAGILTPPAASPDASGVRQPQELSGSLGDMRPVAGPLGLPDSDEASGRRSSQGAFSGRSVGTRSRRGA